MLEDELVVDELEESSRVERSTANVHKVLDVVSGWVLAFVYRLVVEAYGPRTLQSQAWASQLCGH